MRVYRYVYVRTCEYETLRERIVQWRELLRTDDEEVSEFKVPDKVCILPHIFREESFSRCGIDALRENLIKK